VVAGGVAVVSLGTGLVLGAMTLSTKAARDAECEAGLCSREGMALDRNARRLYYR
jgi:hypothetical protein